MEFANIIAKISVGEFAKKRVKFACAQALLGVAGDGYDLRDLPGGKAGVLLFTWNRAALDLRAQGFQPKTEAR